MQNNFKVLVVGLPNVGKSALINSICKTNLKTANFAGVTVKKQSVILKTKEKNIEFIDLPGIYDYQEPKSIDEVIAKNSINEGNFDLILQVINTNQIEQSLFLSYELLNLQKKVVFAFNMLDESNIKNIKLHHQKILTDLKIDNFFVSSKTKEGINELVDSIKNIDKKKCYQMPYLPIIEKQIDIIATYIKIQISFLKPNAKENFSQKLQNLDYKKIAVNLLNHDKKTQNILAKFINIKKLNDQLKTCLINILKELGIKNQEQIWQKNKIYFSQYFLKKSQLIRPKNNSVKKQKFSSKIDKIFLNKYLGLPIFLFIIWSVFQLTFVLGDYPMQAIENTISFLSVFGFKVLGSGDFSSLLIDGVLAGVGAVLVFLPNIIILFLAISFLETTGYMNRVVFLLDGTLYKFGLHGHAFIPLITGFGCSVPAYMAARSLKNKSDRLITLFIMGFMSCGAKLPIYIIFAGAFFSENAANAVFFIYIISAFFGLALAKFLRNFVFKKQNQHFALELPPYRMPNISLVYNRVKKQALAYLKRAGTFILIASVAIWILSNYPKNDQKISTENLKTSEITNENIALSLDDEISLDLQKQLVDLEKNSTLTQEQLNLKNSYLGQIGIKSNAIFEPLGFDWQMSVALFTSLIAKELVVSTLAILYNQTNDAKDEALMQKIKTQISFASAVSFIIFIIAYLPCFAASIVFIKESGHIKYFFYLFFATSFIAWIFAFFVYNLILFFGRF